MHPPGLPAGDGFGMVRRMKFRLVIEFDPEAKRWSAVFPDLPGCGSAGDSEEVIANAMKHWHRGLSRLQLELGKDLSCSKRRSREPVSCNAHDVVRVLRRHGFVFHVQRGGHQKATS
jgi:hypothetical protein